MIIANLLTTCVEGADRVNNALKVAAWRQANHEYRELASKGGGSLP